MPKRTSRRIIDSRSRNRATTITGVTLTAPAPGNIASSVAGAGLTYQAGVLNIGAGNGITINADDVALASSVAGAGLTYQAGVLNIGAGNGITINADDVALASSVAGAGLTYQAGVLNIGAGNGITINADDVALASSVAGAGLTYQAGVLNIGAGNGITINADDVALASSVAGAGLTYQAGVLNIGAGNGITINADDVALASSVAGAGLTYQAGVLNIGAGNGITINADDVALASSVAGAGLTYQAGVLNIGAGNGITVNADDVALRLRTNSGLVVDTTGLAMGTPGTLAATSVNAVTTTTHSHAVTTTADGDANVSTILRTDALGALRVRTLEAGVVGWPGNQVIAPDGDLWIEPGGGDILLTANLATDDWASQTTGWGVTSAGSADFRYLYTDQLHAKSFVADLEQALAGAQRITKSVGVVAKPFVAPAPGGTAYLWVEDLPGASNMQAFESGDIVNLRAFSRVLGGLEVADCWGVVSGYTDGAGADEGQQRWTFTRSSGSTSVSTITQRGSATSATAQGTPGGYSTIAQRGVATTATGQGAPVGYNTITQRGTATSGNTYTTSLSVSRPTGVVENDVLVAIVTWWANTLTAPTGWTQIGTTQSWSHPDGTIYARAYYRVAGASEPSSYAWGLNAINDIACTIVAYSNVDTTNPIAANGAQTQTSTSMTAPTINAATAADMLLFLGAVGDTDAGSRTATPPSGMTELADTTSGTSWIKAYAAHQLLTVSGATGTRTATLSASSRNAAFLVSLRPSGTSGSNASVAVNRPTGVVENDVLVATVVFAGGSLTAPAGWTQVLSQAATGGTLEVWRKTAGASEPANFTWALDSTDALSVACVAYSGVDTTTTIGASASQANSSSTSMVAPTVTPATPADMLIFCGGVAGNIRATAPDGMGEEADAGATGVGVYVADQLLTSGDATGAKTATLASSAANAGALVTLRSIYTAGSNSSLSVSRPTGVVEGDVLVTAVAYRGGSLTAPSGWTQAILQGGSGVTAAVYYRVAGASEPSSYAWALDSTDALAAGVIAFYNAYVANPVSDVVGVAVATSSYTTSPSATAATTGDLWLKIAGVATNVRVTPAAGTEQVDVGIGGLGLWMASQLLAASGATGSQNHNYASGVTASAGVSLLLRAIVSSSGTAGAMTAGATVPKGGLALDYGVSGNGYYEVTTIDGLWGSNSPHFDVVTWATHPGDPVNRVTRLRGGNLNGLAGFAGEWGLWLRGATDNEYVAAGTNGVRLRNADFTVYNVSNQRTISLAKAGSAKFGTNIDTAAGTGFAFDAATGAITIGSATYASTVTVHGVINIRSGSSGIGSFADAGALATVNNLDGVPDGASYKRTTTNEKTGAGRAYAALDAAGALLTRVDPATAWGANPGAGYAGLLLGSDYMGYWSGSAWRSYMDSVGRFYLNAGAGSNYLAWDGSTLNISGAINVVGGNAATLGNVTGASNLVANASFEADSNGDGLADGFSGYSWDATISASLVAGSKSSWAQRISWSGTNANVKGIYFNAGTKRADVDYVLSFWARTSASVGLAVNENPPGATTRNYLIWPTANTSWQFFAIRMRWASAPDQGWYLSINHGEQITNGWIDFDNIQVVEGAEIVPWALAPTDKANTSLDNSVLSTLISGANVRVGSGVKDFTLNGWNIDATEIVGQAAGVDQVVLDTSGTITAGVGRVIMSASGLVVLADASGSNTLSAYRFRNAANAANVGGMSAWVGAANWQSNSQTTGQRVNVSSLGQSSQDSGLTLYAEAVSGRTAISALQSYVVGGALAAVEVRSIAGASEISAIADRFLISGIAGADWTALTPNNNWTNYGSPNATLGYKTFGSLVSIKGVVRAGASISANTAISNTQLPVAARPLNGRSFACMGSIGGAKAVVRIYVDTSGYLRPQDGFSNTDWISVELSYFTGG